MSKDQDFSAAPSRGIDAANAERRRRYRVRSMINGVGYTFAGARRGHSQVLRASRTVGDAELSKWRRNNVFPRIEKETRLEQIYAWSDEHKLKGKAWGLLTPKQKIIIKVMHDARCYTTGRLDWAWAQICQMAKCTTQTLSTALKKFEGLGLIERWRRMVPVHNPDPGGARYTQINNAYFLKLPDAVANRVRDVLAKLSKIVLPPVPPPRQPTEYERQAVATAQIRASYEGPEASARQQHYANSMTADAIARQSAGRASQLGDSSS